MSKHSFVSAVVLLILAAACGVPPPGGDRGNDEDDDDNDASEGEGEGEEGEGEEEEGLVTFTADGSSISLENVGVSQNAFGFLLSAQTSGGGEDILIQMASDIRTSSCAGFSTTINFSAPDGTGYRASSNDAASSCTIEVTAVPSAGGRLQGTFSATLVAAFGGGETATIVGGSFDGAP